MTKIHNLTNSPLTLPTGELVPKNGCVDVDKFDAKHPVMAAMIKSRQIVKGKIPANLAPLDDDTAKADIADAVSKAVEPLQTKIDAATKATQDLIAATGAEYVDDAKAEKAFADLRGALGITK